MKFLRTAGTALVACLAFVAAACSDFPVEPADAPGDISAAELAPAFALEAGALQTTGDHIVVFRGSGVPAAFEGRITALGGSVIRTHPQIGIALVTGLDGAGVASLADQSWALAVEEDVLLPLDLPESALEVTHLPGFEGGTAIGSAHDPSSASFFARQWHLRAIQAPEAWAVGGTGSPGVTVAILDTGIDYLYPDLVGRVDLGRSASFVTDDDPYLDFYFPDRERFTDLHYHGTHVAATTASNGFVAAGVTRDVTLMAVKVCNVFGSCPAASVFAGLLHAADNGAQVANLSLGGAFAKSANPGYVATVQRLLNHVSRQGMLVVVAAGNNDSDLDRNLYRPRDPNTNQLLDPIHIPSLFATYCDGAATLCVSATAPTSGGTVGPWTDVDTPASYTNYGRSAIDVAAPGGGAGGAVWAGCSTSSLQVPVCQTGTFIIGISGTSMAAPHASGVAALLMERLGGNVGAVSTAMHRTADGSGNDPHLGKGRVNALNATSLSTPSRGRP